MKNLSVLIRIELIGAHIPPKVEEPRLVKGLRLAIELNGEQLKTAVYGACLPWMGGIESLTLGRIDIESDG